MTLTVNDKPIVVPETVRRKAGFRPGDRLEFRVSRRAITIVPQSRDVSDDYTPAERRAINRGIAQSEEEYRAGLGVGPFSTAEEFLADLHREAAKLDAQETQAKKRKRARK